MKRLVLEISVQVPDDYDDEDVIGGVEDWVQGARQYPAWNFFHEVGKEVLEIEDVYVCEECGDDVKSGVRFCADCQKRKE